MNRIIEDLSKRIAQALKEGDRIRLETLRALRASVIEFEKSGKAEELTIDILIDLVLSQIKRRREAIEQYKKANRVDLATKEEQELQVLQEFLPPPLSPEGLEQAIRDELLYIGATRETKPGTVIGAIIKKLKGRAENAQISATVIKVLQSL